MAFFWSPKIVVLSKVVVPLSVMGKYYVSSANWCWPANIKF